MSEAQTSEFKWHEVNSIDEMEAFFRSRLPAIREAAKNCGYAIGLHGSLRRDLDLVAVPWIEGHTDADTLARSVHIAACGLSSVYQWEQKPAGRIATSMPICWTGGKMGYNTPNLGHIDLSIMPSAAWDAAIAREGAQSNAVTDEMIHAALNAHAEIKDGDGQYWFHGLSGDLYDQYMDGMRRAIVAALAARQGDDRGDAERAGYVRGMEVAAEKCREIGAKGTLTGKMYSEDCAAAIDALIYTARDAERGGVK